MPFVVVVNQSPSIASPSDKQAFIRELTALRAELTDLRTKYAAVLAKLDADAGVTDTNYGTVGALAAIQFTPT